MDLESITVAIRPRNPWEAIDTGFVLARRYCWKLWLLWLLTAIPLLMVVLGLSLLLPGETAKWTLLLFWFFKPVYEPPLLFWISQALFGSQSSLKGSLKKTWQTLSIQRTVTMLIHRFSPYRSFSLPVLLLEKLTGKEAKERRTLLRESQPIAIILTLAGFGLELLLTFSLLAVLHWLIPEELRWVDGGRFVLASDNWLLLLSYIVCCLLFAPFYVCAGFMMYISRRVELEAWDIEIGFKRMQQRLQKRAGNGGKVTAAMLLIVLPLTCLPGRSWAAAPEPEIAHTTITSILAQKDFGETVKQSRWVPKIAEAEEPEDSPWLRFWAKFFSFLGKSLANISPTTALLGEILLWCGGTALVIYLLLKYTGLRNWLYISLGSEKNTYTPPDIMFGMDIRPESLPDDIAKSCAQLLADGRKREAMGLLYRGTLSLLINSHNLEIHSSLTEGECCAEVVKTRPAPESTFFDALTRLWVIIAYGHRDPDSSACNELVDRWKHLYGVQA